MTIEQITAINNGMSMLVGLYEYASGVMSLEDYKEYTDRHVKALKDLGVNRLIVEHFEALIHSYFAVAERSVAEFERAVMEDMAYDDFSIEVTPTYHSLEEDLAALTELKTKLEANNSSL